MWGSVKNCRCNCKKPRPWRTECEPSLRQCWNKGSVAQISRGDSRTFIWFDIMLLDSDPSLIHQPPTFNSASNCGFWDVEFEGYVPAKTSKEVLCPTPCSLKPIHSSKPKIAGGFKPSSGHQLRLSRRAACGGTPKHIDFRASCMHDSMEGSS